MTTSTRVRAREPAVEPAPDVPPAFQPRRESRAYCATPMERFDWTRSQQPAPAPSGRRNEVEVCRTVTETRCTVEGGYTIDVRELVYPGGPGDAAPVEGKWVYAFRNQKLAVEAKAAGAGVWEGVTIEGSRRRRWRSRNGLRVDPGPSGGRHAYFFFLSPIQLTSSAIRYLEESGRLDLAAVECLCSEHGATVLAPDPLRWAADVHARYYTPRVETLRAWECGEEMVACAFVAGVLQAWIDAGDQAGVADELARKPKEWLDARKKGIEEARKRAEVAAAYLGHCVDAPEYYAIELSCRERGGEDLEVGAVALACLTGDLLATEPGRRLAQQLAGDPKHLPRYLLFQDERAPLPQEWFERHRFGEKALLAVFSDLLPAVIQLTLQRGQGIRAVETQRDRIRRYLENLRIETTLKAPQVEILGRLQKGQKISEGVPRGSKGWRAIQHQWRKLALVEDVRKGFPTHAEVSAETWSKRLESFSAARKGFGWTVGSVIELANVLNAYEALREATPDQRGDRLRSVVGAWSDLMEHGGGLVEDLLRECAGKRALKGAVGVFAFVGSALDMVEFEGQLVDALGEYDYGKSVGRGLQVAGAFTGAVGGGMVLAGAIYGGSLGPVGALVGAIGGVLVAAGFVLAAWLSHNANETFASRCFLGKERGKAPAKTDWGTINLPTSSLTDEVSSLVSLLAQFRIRPSANLGPWYVHVEPGYLEAHWKLEVNLRNSWSNDRPQEYRVVVDLDADVVTQVSGVPLSPQSRIDRDAEGRVKWVSICVDEAKVPEYPLRQFHVARARVRLVIDRARQVPKERGTAVEITLPTSEVVGTLDGSRWAPMEGETR